MMMLPFSVGICETEAAFCAQGRPATKPMTDWTLLSLGAPPDTLARVLGGHPTLGDDLCGLVALSVVRQRSSYR
jgi:hypothetical protein